MVKMAHSQNLFEFPLTIVGYPPVYGSGCSQDQIPGSKGSMFLEMLRPEIVPSFCFGCYIQSWPFWFQWFRLSD